MRGTHPLTFAALLGLVVALTGCATGGSQPAPATTQAIREINLLIQPVALNLDANPGADGIALKVFAVAEGSPKAVPIRKGALDIEAYDGTLEAGQPSGSFHTWHFEPADLAPHQFNTALGTGYNLTLSWAPKVLRRDRVTVAARYVAPDGQAVVSAPIAIAATSH
jgi:hypothetical protein